MSRKSVSKSTDPTSKKNTRKPLKTLKLTPCDSHDDVEPPSKKHRAGFTVRRPRKVCPSSALIVLIHPPQLSNPPVLDLTNDDTIMASSSQGSTGSRLAKPLIRGQQPLVDVKGKCKETRTLGDSEDDSLWVDKYEPMSEVRRVLSLRSPSIMHRVCMYPLHGHTKPKR